MLNMAVFPHRLVTILCQQWSSDSEEEQLDTGTTKLTKREALNVMKESNGDITG